jgi:5-formyltetrahydrofolate cyclo-ligase
LDCYLSGAAVPVFEPFEHRHAIAVKAKSMMRKQMRAVRATVQGDVLAGQSERIVSRLMELPAFSEAKVLALCGIPSGHRGVDTTRLADKARERGMIVVYPRMDFDAQCVEFRIAKESELESRGLNTAEAPSWAPLVSPDTIDLIVVPVLAVDPSGVFIGDGSGAYDHALQDTVHATALAVAFDFQLIPEAPRTSDDVPVAVVVTERRVIEARGERSAMGEDGASGTSRAAKEVRRAKQPDLVAGSVPSADRAGGGTRRRIGQHP